MCRLLTISYAIKIKRLVSFSGKSATGELSPHTVVLPNERLLYHFVFIRQTQKYIKLFRLVSNFVSFLEFTLISDS